MKEFKEGDKVVCSELGDGYVINVEKTGYMKCPVHVKFHTDGGEELYTRDGRLYPYGPITLRHAEPEQAHLPDLTKILKVGDNAWSPQTGEAKVIESPTPIYPILLERSDLSRVGFDKYGRRDEYDAFPSVRPIDQIPAPPQWPTQPQTYEWEGEVYETGEWVAVRSSIGSFKIHQLDFVNHKHDYPINTEYGWVWNEMRKLTSFNQSDQTSREEKEMALNCYMNQEYDLALTKAQISDIFNLIEK